MGITIESLRCSTLHSLGNGKSSCSDALLIIAEQSVNDSEAVSGESVSAAVTSVPQNAEDAYTNTQASLAGEAEVPVIPRHQLELELRMVGRDLRGHLQFTLHHLQGLTNKVHEMMNQWQHIIGDLSNSQ
ncbi:hypothetical protein P691DRAFT_765261 [Macrolepiota fuliginosa MF-IS2]|uniref:Uncharacterized protein n=1 Tax=Macrolepiota fuliginosa MF-IS2 TaxID=1400762 RepID=A0A9P5X1Q9_9AGAR|nr:hypothetical protein P691DRAFT_765261 [Macrolepiota fuliginosa MF-IS2]